MLYLFERPEWLYVRRIVVCEITTIIFSCLILCFRILLAVLAI
ncbi:hypothetical protein EVA_11077 [gut metagenome]|uniref:Uncharacterized protein n=1 Tax=gut metagenome TaxID=749906 RepID=J9GLZ4_9ZZZZ